jgi:hypothetical protein
MTKPAGRVVRSPKKADKTARYSNRSQTLAVSKLASRLNIYAEGHTWDAAAKKYEITDTKGRPSPGLAFMIAGGYMPGIEVCMRLGIRAKCPSCSRPMTRNHKHVPDWVTRGADFLAERERSRR